MNKETSAYCGIDCTTCAIYQATALSDDEMKKKVAIEWGKLMQTELAPSDINCKGCKSDEVYKFCVNCGFKACCKKKDIENCKECEDFPCETHKNFSEFQEPFGTKITFI